METKPMEAALEEKFKKIFGIEKVTYVEPGPAQEQECIFIEVTDIQDRFKDGREVARVTGNAVIYGNADKLKFGFLSRAIANSKPEDSKDLFFYDFESNERRYQNIVQRGLSFIYFFNSQYDPNLGSMESIEFNLEVT